VPVAGLEEPLKAHLGPETFRSAFVDWLRDNERRLEPYRSYRPGPIGDVFTHNHGLRLLLAEEGWIRYGWPEEAGGKGGDALLRAILYDDLIGAGYVIPEAEPNAGSDMGFIRTRAVADGETFRVNGQKTWVSFGHLADGCGLLAGTGDTESRHRGLSILWVDMSLTCGNAPGLPVLLGMNPGIR
jgi:acyl-CoA dehydrogenase